MLSRRTIGRASQLIYVLSELHGRRGSLCCIVPLSNRKCRTWSTRSWPMLVDGTGDRASGGRIDIAVQGSDCVTFSVFNWIVRDGMSHLTEKHRRYSWAKGSYKMFELPSNVQSTDHSSVSLSGRRCCEGGLIRR